MKMLRKKSRIGNLCMKMLRKKAELAILGSVHIFGDLAAKKKKKSMNWQERKKS